MSDFEFKLYPKIQGPFKRHTEGELKNQLDRTRWSHEAFETLQDVPWVWSEKVDGTNIRVGWDGYRVHFGGRTDKADIPKPLLAYLTQSFPEELFEQQFGEQSAILYGEGYGGKIQKGGNYRPDESFVLFDVRVGKWWLKPEDTADVGQALGIDVVPTHMFKDFTLNHAINTMTTLGWMSKLSGQMAEGLVGVPVGGLLDRAGNRIQVKVKYVDFFKG